MSVLVAPETRYGIEMWRWDHTDSETNPFDPTVKGMRPTHPQQLPEMMYRATQKNPWLFDKEVASTEPERDNLRSRGFVSGGPARAAEHYDAQQQEFAVLAAHRNFEDRNMSDKAKAESNAAEQASSTHLPTIEPKPVKRGRKPKVKADA